VVARQAQGKEVLRGSEDDPALSRADTAEPAAVRRAA
jgi:hypothetical protein